MLSGRYPSDEFAELRPRIVFDRVSGEISGRPGAQRLAVTSGGTIPDRGLFGVFLVGESTNHRVGELDEEMVYESRVGDVFTLGASSWRIEDITHDRVLVSPAPGPAWTPPVLEGRRGRSPGGARSRDRRVRSDDGRAATGQGDQAGTRRGPRRVRRQQPGRVPRRATRGDQPGAGRHHDRGRAVPRRARRLAGLHPLAVRRSGARAVGAGDRRAAARAVRDGCPVGVGRRRDRAAAAGDRRAAAGCRAGAVRPGGDRGPGHRGGRWLGVVRGPLPRVRGARSAAAAAQSGQAIAAVAAAAAVGAAAERGQQVRVVPDRAGDAARGAAGRLRPGRR